MKQLRRNPAGDTPALDLIGAPTSERDMAGARMTPV